MNTRRRGLIYAACAVLVTALVGLPTVAFATPGTPGTANSSPGSNATLTPAEVAHAQAVQNRFLAGTQTAADVTWAKQNPDISNWMLDPSKSTLRLISSTKVANPDSTVANPDSTATLASTFCTWNSYGGDEYGFGGLHLYTYFSEVEYCADSTQVTSIPVHDAYFMNVSGGVNVVTNMLRNATSLSGVNGTVAHEGHAQYCYTPYGCLFNYYPQINWTLYPWSPATVHFTH